VVGGVGAVIFIREPAGIRGWWEPIGEQVAGGGGSECRNRLWRGRYISAVSERSRTVWLAWLGMRSLYSVVGEASPFTPAYEDGTDRGFRNVGIYKPDAGELPKRKSTIFRARRKFEIKKNTVGLSTDTPFCHGFCRNLEKSNWKASHILKWN
jgi:hypothetical protein